MHTEELMLHINSLDAADILGYKHTLLMTISILRLPAYGYAQCSMQFIFEMMHTVQKLHTASFVLDMNSFGATSQ